MLTQRLNAKAFGFLMDQRRKRFQTDNIAGTLGAPTATAWLLRGSTGAGAISCDTEPIRAFPKHQALVIAKQVTGSGHGSMRWTQS
jgi:hypothetical protein